MDIPKLSLQILESEYGVCKLGNKEEIPDWVNCSDLFFSITKTPDELSIVCEQSIIPEGLTVEKNWRILQVQGKLDFSLVGILAAISTSLANAGISIFAISTYDTDYILVKEEDLRRSIEALIQAGYDIKQS